MAGPRDSTGSKRVRTVELTDGDRTVAATKLVSMGELLVIEHGEDRLKLDAMLLEGLSWQQGAGDLAEFVADPEAVLDDPASAYDGRPVEATDRFTVANEYTTVEVGRVEAGGADALQLASEKGVTVLGLPTLVALTTVESTLGFSRWCRTPIGPEQPL
jgi:hypothetical protein